MDIFRRTPAIVAATALAVGLASPAAASTQTGLIEVAITIVPTCVIKTTDMNFGTFTSSEPTDDLGTSNITTTCSLLTSFTLGLDGGLHADGAQRRMSDGNGNFVRYSIARDVARTQLLRPAVDLVPLIGTGLPQVTQLYGSVPTGQNVPAGTYTDRITVTVDF